MKIDINYRHLTNNKAKEKVEIAKIWNVNFRFLSRKILENFAKSSFIHFIHFVDETGANSSQNEIERLIEKETLTKYSIDRSAQVSMCVDVKLLTEMLRQLVCWVSQLSTNW